MQDILIIGGGVIGLSAALELAGAGAKVTVLERGVAGAESSWAGGGILSPLLPWDYAEPVTRLAGWSAGLYPAWAGALHEATGIDPEWRQSGILVLPDYDEAAARVWCSAHGAEFDRVEAKAVAPALGVEAEALWLPQVAQVRNPRLLKALRRRIDQIGVRLVEQAEVTGFRFSGSRLVAVSTSEGEFAAGAVVVAAGAWSRQVLGDLAPQPDIRPVRGQMLLFRAAPGSLRQIVLQNGTYLIPRDDGHILAGSTLEEVGFDKGVTAEAKARLMAEAARLLPLLGNAELVRHWSGLRPGSPGNVPVIGRHPEIENLYLDSGHFRYGVTMAPGSARLLADLLLGRTPPLDVAAYRWPA